MIETSPPPGAEREHFSHRAGEGHAAMAMIAWPVMKAEAGEARKTARPAMSRAHQAAGRRSQGALQEVGVLPEGTGEVGPDERRCS